jgi:hypothetical protein
VSTGAVRRDACVVCGAGSLEPVVTVPSFPVFQGCVAFAPEPGERAPMPWAGCTVCGSAQIVALPAIDRIYQGGHATGLGAAWARHHAAFATFLRAHVHGHIVDVGGGSGTLAAAYRKCGGEAPWTILEPNALKSPDLPADIEVVDGFLDGDVLRRLGAESVVMCHMLEHVIDLRATIAQLSDCLPGNGRILLAWPELETWTRAGLAGALNFEHGIYVTVERLDALFQELGWRLSAKQRFAENDTLFMTFVRGASTRNDRAPRSRATEAIAAYYAGFRAAAEKITRTLAAHRGDAFLMPASVYAQTLLASGLDETRFAAVLDNATIKQCRRLYGTTLRVEAPAAALAAAKSPLVVLNAGAHETEIASLLRAVRKDVRVINGHGVSVEPEASPARTARQVLPQEGSFVRTRQANA